MVTDPQIIEKDLCAIFSPEWLRDMARQTGLVKRERKIDPSIMFWVLVFGFGVRLQHTLASLKRSYEKESDKSLSDGSWYERFTPELVVFLKVCVSHAMNILLKNKTKNSVKNFQRLMMY